MKELEIDEDMFEEDKINRFLNMIATQYDGNLATEYCSYYLKKCNEIKKYKQVLDKIKEEIELLGIVDCNIPNYIICISKINELLEEIK